jgi:hypothetical protein
VLNQRFSAILLVTVAAMAVASVVLTYGLLFGSKIISNQGNVSTIGVAVYWEDTCVNNVTRIDWGLIEPGASENVTVYILNSGTVPMTLNMTTDNWDPAAASTDIALSWDREGNAVNAQSVLQAVLTLSVSSSISDVSSFSFDITITGTE